MKIVFFGNTDFGIPTLDLLKDQKYNILVKYETVRKKAEDWSFKYFIVKLLILK